MSDAIKVGGVPKSKARVREEVEGRAEQSRAERGRLVTNELGGMRRE